MVNNLRPRSRTRAFVGTSFGRFGQNDVGEGQAAHANHPTAIVETGDLHTLAAEQPQ
jgi:hypothetical protein